MEPRLLAAAAAVLLILPSVAVLLSGPVSEPVPATDGDGYNVTDDGRRYTVHPSKLVWGCPGRDCIPSIDSPRFQRASSASSWLQDDDLVLGVMINGRAKAYPLRILTVHEIVNDRLGGKPIVVTYCPLCRSGLVFSRRVEGRTLTFGVSGRLRNANLVMYDRQTETLWQQIGGKAIVGPLVPAKLDLISSSLTEWRDWRQEHPGTRVLSRNTGIYPNSQYRGDPYSGYAESEQVGFGVSQVNDTLPSKAIVYGVRTVDGVKAYPEQLVRQQDVINDNVGSTPVLVAVAPDGGVMVFERRLDGETVRFQRRDGLLVDDDGTRWRFTDAALVSADGDELSRIPSHGIYWFAWSKFHPETAVYTTGE